MDIKIKMFTLSTCIYCQNTKAFLKSLDVPFDYIDVDLLTPDEKPKIMREIRNLTASVSFPTIVIGEKIVTGYRPDEIRKALGL